MWTDANPEADAREAQRIAATAGKELRARLDLDHADALFVMGSGWKEAADSLGETVAELPMTDLPGFVAPSAAGHAGTIRVVARGTRRLLVFFGRTHLYEGYGPLAVAHGVRTAIAAGAETVVLSNACGGLNADLPIGEPALIRDHINFTARTPLIGARFVDLTDTYSPRLREAIAARNPGIGEGVYAGWYGPAFETPAEIELMHRLGADMVGMSTVLEAIAAREAGAEVVGLSLVTNRAAGLAGKKLSGEEVLEVARNAIPRLRPFLDGVAAAVLGESI